MFESQQLQHFGSAYSEIKYWLPLISIATILWKARTAVTEWADKLFSNHLSHIEEATVSNAKEAKETNVILNTQSGKLDMVQNTLADNQTKNLLIWDGVVRTLALLEDRTREVHKTPKRKRHA
jgi:hypothetical protein